MPLSYPLSLDNWQDLQKCASSVNGTKTSLLSTYAWQYLYVTLSLINVLDSIILCLFVFSMFGSIFVDIQLSIPHSISQLSDRKVMGIRRLGWWQHCLWSSGLRVGLRLWKMSLNQESPVDELKGNRTKHLPEVSSHRRTPLSYQCRYFGGFYMCPLHQFSSETSCIISVAFKKGGCGSFPNF